jgi:peptide/nickel transport system substrate-binding protein
LAEPFTFEILLVTGQDDAMASIADIYIEALKPLGITATVNRIDDAQYKERTTDYDFDMTHYIRSLSLSPGNEQMTLLGLCRGNRTGNAQLDGREFPRDRGSSGGHGQSPRYHRIRRSNTRA